jgi:hypothetical protein
MYSGTGTVLSGNKLVRQKKVLDWINVGTIQKTICTPAGNYKKIRVLSLSNCVVFYC